AESRRGCGAVLLRLPVLRRRRRRRVERRRDAQGRAPMTLPPRAPALKALDIAPRARQTQYPEPFASRVAGREKRALGDAFGLTNFGVNLTRLAPRAVSSLRHAHIRQDELVYILEGRPTLITD